MYTYVRSNRQVLSINSSNTRIGRVRTKNELHRRDATEPAERPNVSSVHGPGASNKPK